MGNKLLDYIEDLQQFFDSGEEIENIEAFKQELLTEIGFWQHERFIHLIVTFLFGLLTMSVFVLIIFYQSIAVLLLLMVLVGILIPYIKHYYVLENGVQKLYVIYEDFARRQLPEGVPEVCIPEWKKDGSKPSASGNVEKQAEAAEDKAAQNEEVQDEAEKDEPVKDEAVSAAADSSEEAASDITESADSAESEPAAAQKPAEKSNSSGHRGKNRKKK